MSHKHSFCLGGHNVTSDIGGHSKRDPQVKIKKGPRRLKKKTVPRNKISPKII